jgi:DNA-directed RNA polymerase subunit RPC12/RpoP
MKCDKCGYEGSRAVFKWIEPIEPGLRDSYRRCPGCGSRVMCDEFAEDERTSQKKPWGFKALGRKSRRGMEKDADV